MNDNPKLTGDLKKDLQTLREIQKRRHEDIIKKKRGVALVLEGIALLEGEDSKGAKEVGAKLNADLQRYEMMTEFGDALLKTMAEANDIGEDAPAEHHRMLGKN